MIALTYQFSVKSLAPYHDSGDSSDESDEAPVKEKLYDENSQILSLYIARDGEKVTWSTVSVAILKTPEF